MIPFWMKLWTERSDGIWAAPGLVKYTQDCFQLGSMSIDHGQKEQHLPFLSQLQHPLMSLYSPSRSETLASLENRDRGKMTLLRSCTTLPASLTRSPESCDAADPYPFKGHSSLQTSDILVSIWSARNTWTSCPERRLPNGQLDVAVSQQARHLYRASSPPACSRQACSFSFYTVFGLRFLLILTTYGSLPSLSSLCYERGIPLTK